MALTAKLLQLRPISRPIPNPSFTRFFSDEPNPSPNSTTTDSDATSSRSQSQSSFSSYLSDVKASLKQQPPPFPSRRPSPPRAPFNIPSNTKSGKPPSTIESLEEIRKNLSEFRLRAAPPLPSISHDGRPPSSPPSQHISFQELFTRNVISKGGNVSDNTNQLPAGKRSFDSLRESLSQLKKSLANNQAGGIGNMKDSLSSQLKERLKLRPMDPNAKESPSVIGGSDDLPLSVFGKEMRGTEEDPRDKDAMRTEFLKMYSHEELGQKLRMLRPEKKDEKSGFSLAELNERLKKLREYEETEREKTIGGVVFKDLRDSLWKLKVAQDDSKKSTTSKFKLL